MKLSNSRLNLTELPLTAVGLLYHQQMGCSGMLTRVAPLSIQYRSQRVTYTGSASIQDDHVDKGKVYALFDDKLGTQEFTFEHEDLSYPLGVTSDSRGNVYVVGCSTNNVLQLNSEGTFVRQILPRDKDDAISNPMGIRVTTMGSSPKLLLTCQNEIRMYDFDSQ